MEKPELMPEQFLNMLENGAASREQIACDYIAGMTCLLYTSYGLKLANVDMNRKMLAEMAVNDPAGFAAVAEVAKSKLA